MTDHTSVRLTVETRDRLRAVKHQEMCASYGEAIEILLEEYEANNE